MTTALDTEARAEVAAALDEIGTSVTFKSAAGTGDYDRDTGTVTHTPTSYVVKVAPPYQVEARLVDGDTIKATDMQTIVAATAAEAVSLTPEAGMTFVHSGSTYTVLRVSPIYSGDLATAYEVFVRRGS